MLILSISCLSSQVFAQQSFTLNGIVLKKGASERIAQVLITNLNNKVVMMSDELGWFKIKASTGDTLLFTSYNYTPQKVVVLNSADLPVYMQPIIQLDQVIIKGQTKKQELNDVMREYRSQGTFYNGKPPALAVLNSPLTGLYELFGKTPGRARRFAEFSKGELEYAAVKRRYTKALVQRITSLPDSELQKFMDNFTPSYEDLKIWNDYELIAYINKSLDYYKKNKDQVTLQKLY